MTDRRQKTRRILAFLALVVGIGAFFPMPRAEATLSLSQGNSVEFGTVSSALRRPVHLANREGEATTIESVSIVGSGFVVADDNCIGTTMHNHTGCHVWVTPEPTGPGLHTAILRVVHTNGTIDIPVTATFEIFEQVFFGLHSSETPNPIAAWLGSGVESALATSSTVNIKALGKELDLRLPTGEIFEIGATWTGLPDKSTKGQAWLDVGCRGTADIVVDDARYMPDGSVEVLTLSVAVRCDAEDVVRNIVVHVADINNSGVVIGPHNLDISRVLEGDRAGSAFIYNGTTASVDVDVTTTPVVGANVDDRCPASLESHGACSVIVSAPLGSTSGPVNGTLAITADAAELDVSYQAIHETAAYLHRVAWGSSQTLRAWDETTPGRRMVVRSNDPRSISFSSIEDGTGWNIGIIGLVASGDLAPGRYDLVPGAPKPGQIDVTSNILCISRSGVVEIHEYETDGERINRISASVVVYCNDDVLPTDFLDFRYNVELDNPWIAVSDRDIRFEKVVRFEPTTSTVVVTNHGRGPGTVQALVVGSPSFSVGEGCIGTVLAAGQACTLTIAASTDKRLSGLEEARVFIGITGGALGFTDVAVDAYFDTPDLSRSGYWVLQDDGTVTPFGDAQHIFGGDLQGKFVHIEPTWDGRGYWLLDSNGLVYAFANAGRFGSVSIALEPGEHVTTMASTPDSRGYWVFTNRGRVMPFGNAPDIGDLLAFDLAGEIVASTSSPTGRGAYMIGSDGGVFALGDALFAGSIPQVLPGVTLNQPVVGLVADPDGSGYWMVAADGGVFAFDAPYRGSVPAVLPPGVQVAAPVNGMVPFFDGYLLVASDGGVFNFSSEPFQGSLAQNELDSPVIAIAPLL